MIILDMVMYIWYIYKSLNQLKGSKNSEVKLKKEKIL